MPLRTDQPSRTLRARRTCCARGALLSRQADWTGWTLRPDRSNWACGSGWTYCPSRSHRASRTDRPSRTCGPNRTCWPYGARCSSRTCWTLWTYTANGTGGSCRTICSRGTLRARRTCRSLWSRWPLNSRHSYTGITSFTIQRDGHRHGGRCAGWRRKPLRLSLFVRGIREQNERKYH